MFIVSPQSRTVIKSSFFFISPRIIRAEEDWETSIAFSTREFGNNRPLPVRAPVR